MSTPKVNQVKLANIAIVMILIAGFVAFEVFNAATTYQGFTYLFRDTLYATMLAIAVICVDIGGLSRVLTPQQGRDEPAIIGVLSITWLFVAFVNAMLTWYVIEVGFEANPPVMPSAMRMFAGFIPAILAALIFAVHCAMIFSLGVYLDVTMHGGRRTGTPLGRALQQGRPTTTITREPAYRPTSVSVPSVQRPWPEKQGVQRQQQTLDDLDK